MKYIMAIDDSPTIRASVAFALKQLQYTIEQAENGKDALEKISRLKDEGREPVLCIVDVNMPQMDGLSFLKEFKKTDRFTPVLFLTTESEEGKIRESKTHGASGWIVKPFQTEELVRVATKLIR